MKIQIHESLHSKDSRFTPGFTPIRLGLPDRSPGLDGSMAKLDGGLDGGLDGEPRWLDGEPRWLDGEKLCDHDPSASSLDGSMARWRPRWLDGGLDGFTPELCRVQ